MNAGGLLPAGAPREPRDAVKLLVLEAQSGAPIHAGAADLPGFFAPGDVVVVNDAATMPASLPAHGPAGEPMELRLLGPGRGSTWRVVLFGDGDFRTPTEQRPPPPHLGPGDRLRAGGLAGTVRGVSSISPRLVDLEFDAGRAAVWGALYERGRPIQYAHVPRELSLAAVQTAYAGKPWAAEMPSAGRPLSWSILLALRRRGIKLCALTHAAGLSATGDPALDAALPLRERYEISARTATEITRCRARGGRVIAIGTTVVRALEGAADAGGVLRPGPGETDLRVEPGFRPAVVSALVSGLHPPEESHFRLLSAFADPRALEAAWREAAQLGYRCHELGDLCLLI